jgi:hypothetical protein
MRASVIVVSAVVVAVSSSILAAAGQRKPFVAPRTPWGDPDISGNVTNVFEASTPFERPDDFAGRRLEEVQGDELATFRLELQKRTLSNFEGPLHGPDEWWQNIYDLRKGGQAWFVMDPPDGRIPSMTPEAQQRPRTQVGGSYAPGELWTSASDFNLYDRCITRGLPGSMMPAIYGNSYRIVQSAGQVAIQYEMIHETRVIPLDGRPHIGKDIALYMGDSRGHWEGNTLVVETTNLKDQPGTAGGLFTDAAKLTERFTRISQNELSYDMTINDPKTWTKPWTLHMPYKEDPHYTIYEYACHEGNYMMLDALTGARDLEKKGLSTRVDRGDAGGTLPGNQ